MPDWINDDGSLNEGWAEQAGIPEEHRDFVKSVKDIRSLVKRGADTQREFHSRVKLPQDEAERRSFMQEQFKDILEADENARKTAAEEDAKKKKEAAEAAAKKAEEDRRKAATERLEKAAKALKDKWGDNYDKNLELAQRALRREDLPPVVREAIAQAAGVEIDNLTDEMIVTAITHDPFVAQVLHYIGDLTKDARMETGGGRATSEEELLPAYPHQPQVYCNPETEEEKKMQLWFINRGAKYENKRYVGGFAQPAT